MGNRPKCLDLAQILYQSFIACAAWQGSQIKQANAPDYLAAADGALAAHSDKG